MEEVERERGNPTGAVAGVGLAMSEGCRKEPNRANETTISQGKKDVYTRGLNFVFSLAKNEPREFMLVVYGPGQN